MRENVIIVFSPLPHLFANGALSPQSYTCPLTMSSVDGFCDKCKQELGKNYLVMISLAKENLQVWVVVFVADLYCIAFEKQCVLIAFT